MMCGVQAIFFDEDDARAAATRLSGAGWTCDVGRVRLAGEDDDADHPWAVASDAPELLLEILVDELDGWLDREHGAPTGGWQAASPIELPTQPRRIKKPNEDAPDDR